MPGGRAVAWVGRQQAVSSHPRLTSISSSFPSSFLQHAAAAAVVTADGGGDMAAARGEDRAAWHWQRADSDSNADDTTTSATSAAGAADLPHDTLPIDHTATIFGLYV